MDNASVAMPILSTHELAKNGHRLEYDEDYGYIVNKQTGEKTRFIQRDGVYFLPLLMPKSTGATEDVGFARQG